MMEMISSVMLGAMLIALVSACLSLGWPLMVRMLSDLALFRQRERLYRVSLDHPAVLETLLYRDAEFVINSYLALRHVEPSQIRRLHAGAAGQTKNQEGWRKRRCMEDASKLSEQATREILESYRAAEFAFFLRGFMSGPLGWILLPVLLVLVVLLALVQLVQDSGGSVVGLLGKILAPATSRSDRGADSMEALAALVGQQNQKRRHRVAA